MDKKKLYILGLSYSQTQAGAYALVLAEENGARRIPIIIGAPEAQSIAIQLEGLHPARPLTHDLFLNFATAFDIVITEVNIFKLEEGIFYSELKCETPNGINVKIDARTSDAVALALRFKCPIYTTEEILSKAGIILEFEEKPKQQMPEKEPEKNSVSPKPPKEKSNYSNLDVKELDDLLENAIKNENYEEASLIRDEIIKRKEKKE